MTRSALLALFVATACGPASALLIRPDRDDAEYLEMATRYPATVRLEAPSGGGVLVSPRWVLTAASVVAPLKDAPGRIRPVVGGKPRDVVGVYLHPDWKPGGTADLALLHLAIPVEDVEPTALYRGDSEAGLAVRLVGHGLSGRIGEKPAVNPADRKPRAAVNTVDAVEPRTLALRIKPADDASDLQGAFGPGDRGGPAFVEIDGEILVAGIGSATAERSL